MSDSERVEGNDPGDDNERPNQMNTAEKIKDAIARSESHNEIVIVEIEGDSGDALDAINEVWDGETDYSMFDYEGDDRMDVWGWTDKTPDDKQDWRLYIRFSGEEIEATEEE